MKTNAPVYPRWGKYEKGDHVLVRGHLGGPDREAYIEEIRVDESISHTEIDIRYADGDREIYTLTNRGEIRVRLLKPVEGCDCYSCNLYNQVCADMADMAETSKESPEFAQYVAGWQ